MACLTHERLLCCHRNFNLGNLGERFSELAFYIVDKELWPKHSNYEDFLWSSGKSSGPEDNLEQATCLCLILCAWILNGPVGQ